MTTPLRALRPRFSLLCLLIASLHAVASPTAYAARDKTPDWVATATSTPLKVATGKAHAVVLLDEAVKDINRDGRITTRTRLVLRVLTSDGTRRAAAMLPYHTSSITVRSFKAWHVNPQGTVKTFGKTDTIDVPVSGTLQLYTEARRQVIDATAFAEPGSIFAYEHITDEKTIFLQDAWSFQSDIPVERSSLTVNLPPGWQVSTRTYNHEPVPAIINGTQTTWTLTRLPPLEAEPLGPPLGSLLAGLMVDLIPPPGSVIASQSVPCASWTALSQYYTPLYEAAGTHDAAMKAKADALVAGKTTLWDRIHALALHTQRINYISIFLNAGRGGGDIPRAPVSVFRNNYGDCKDKANLLRVLLKTQGITSHPVFVYSGDADRVRADWVSPGQFNHCILAIAVDETIDTPATLTHPALGRLLIFDPTSEHTPLGWLPTEDAGGRGLLIAGKEGDLIPLPSLTAKDNRWTSRIVAKLSSNGHLSGALDLTYAGVESTEIRAIRTANKTTEFEAGLHRFLADTMHAPKIRRAATKDNFEAATFTVTFDFETTHYGKMMRDELLIVNPVLVARQSGKALKKEKRTQPVRIQPEAFTERNEIELPEGYRVEESCPPVDLKAPFGAYTAKTEIRDNRLFFERTLELRAATLPADDYEVARLFFEKILQAEQSPVVLKRN